MIDTINTDATQDNARALGGLSAGKQIVNSRDLDLPARSVAFTDGTHVTIQAATALPNGTRLNANGLAMDSDNFTNDDVEQYVTTECWREWEDRVWHVTFDEAPGTSEPLIREVDAPGSDEPSYMTEAEHHANDYRYDDSDEEPTLAQLGL